LTPGTLALALLLLNSNLDLLEVFFVNLSLAPELDLLLLLLLLVEGLLEVGNPVIEDRPEYEDLVVQILQSVVEVRMLTLLLRYIDRLAHVLRQGPVRLVLVRLVLLLIFRSSGWRVDFVA